MLNDIDTLGTSILDLVARAGTLEELESVRVSALGKKGSLSELLKGMGAVAAEDRPKIGAAVNRWRAQIEQALSQKQQSLEGVAIAARLASERIDVTLPARAQHFGSLHPITTTLRRLVSVFERLGFEVTTGPEVESEELNFDLINIPRDHPARDMQDTFFVGPGTLLRTHTSPVQMRTMKSRKWPIRILCPGAVYRCDSDATHSPMFHQVEGLWVDRDVRMSDLKGVLEFFAREIFGTETRIRLRPSYFPFVEPGAEVDVSCFNCRKVVSQSCKVCKGTGWLEILGAGMVHPKLFTNAGYDPGEVSGFAFGLGVDRIAMLLHRISDIRLLYQGDIRFLSQF